MAKITTALYSLTHQNHKNTTSCLDNQLGFVVEYHIISTKNLKTEAAQQEFYVALFLLVELLTVSKRPF